MRYVSRTSGHGPESDEEFRRRILRVCTEADRDRIKTAGPYWLDQYGAIYGLKRLEGAPQ
jgi:hypothetical protein